jgi:hypothetical protein
MSHWMPHLGVRYGVSRAGLCGCGVGGNAGLVAAYMKCSASGSPLPASHVPGWQSTDYYCCVWIDSVLLQKQVEGGHSGRREGERVAEGE